MSSRDPILVSSSRLYRFFTRGPHLVSLIDGRLCLDKQGGRGTEDVDIESLDDIRLSRSLFWSRLTVHKTDHTRLSIGGLDLQVAVRFRDAVMETARRHADELGPRLEELGRHVDRVLAGGYLFQAFRVQEVSRGPGFGGSPTRRTRPELLKAESENGVRSACST